MQKNRQNGNSWQPCPDHPLFVAEARGKYDGARPQKGIQTVSVRRPGQRGTLEALREYGERLVCVRYLQDAVRGKRYKTMEIIVHEEDWTPPPTKGNPAETARPKPGRIVFLRLPGAEEALRAKVWEAGGRWDSTAKVWRISYKAACELGLEKRIVNLEGNPE